MYHALVRRRVHGVFASLSAGDWPAVAAGSAEDVHHIFPGDHPLGGERHSREALGRWFERLYRLFPALSFEVRRVVVGGWPWNTWVAVEWVDRTQPLHGEPYTNEGAHWLRIRWGKVVYVHAYLDTQAVAEACRAMAEQGVEEAAAPPIV